MRRPPEENEGLGLLGLARRAGGTVSGVDGVRRGILDGEVAVVIFASDASETQLEKVKKLLRHRDVPVRWVSRREVLGRAVGGDPLSVVGVKTRSFADRLLPILPSDPHERVEGEGEREPESREDAGFRAS